MKTEPTLKLTHVKDKSTLDLEIDRDMNLSLETTIEKRTETACTKIILTPEQTTELIMFLLTNFLNPKK